MTTLYLVRHGENRANITKEFSYRAVDYPLTSKGVLQAEQSAEYFVGRSIDAIYASPLLRARQTAEVLARRIVAPVHLREALREINVGSLEGASTPENSITASARRCMRVRLRLRSRMARICARSRRAFLAASVR